MRPDQPRMVPTLVDASYAAMPLLFSDFPHHIISESCEWRCTMATKPAMAFATRARGAVFRLFLKRGAPWQYAP